MNKMLLFGKVLRFMNFHRLINKHDLNNSVRVMYSHEVKREHFLIFKKTILHLYETYSVMNPLEYFDYLERDKEINGKNILFTFDDGFLSSYHFAKEVLNKYNIKAIFFIPTAILDFDRDSEMKGFVNKNIYYRTDDSKSFINDEYKLMNKKHLLELVADGHFIFPHTHNHIYINSIDDQMIVEKELIYPQQIIQSISGNRLKAFAFPVGTVKQVNKYSYNKVKKYYDYIFTAYSGLTTKRTDNHKIFRSHLPADATESYVDMVMNGVYDFYYIFKMNILSKIID